MWCLGRAGAPRRAVGSRSAQRPCAAGLRRERPCRQSTPAARTCHSTTSCASWRALKRCAGAPHAAAVGGSADAAAMATPSCTALTRGMTSACPPCGPHAPMRPPCAPHARVNPLRPPIRPPAPPCGLRAGQGQARFEKATPRRVQGQKRPAPQRRHIPDLPPAAAQGALGAPGQSNAAAPGSRARSPLACGASRAQHAGTGGSPCDAPPPPFPPHTRAARPAHVRHEGGGARSGAGGRVRRGQEGQNSRAPPQLVRGPRRTNPGPRRSMQPPGARRRLPGRRAAGGAAVQRARSLFLSLAHAPPRVQRHPCTAVRRPGCQRQPSRPMRPRSPAPQEGRRLAQGGLHVCGRGRGGERRRGAPLRWPSTRALRSAHGLRAECARARCLAELWPTPIVAAWPLAPRSTCSRATAPTPTMTHACAS